MDLHGRHMKAVALLFIFANSHKALDSFIGSDSHNMRGMWDE